MAQIFRSFAITILIGAALGVIPARADEPDVKGVWQEIDPDGKVGAYITIKPTADGTYEGTFSKLFLKPTDPPTPTCDGCKGDQKGHPWLGLKLMWGLKRHGLTYEDGTIVDPRDGSEYNVVLTLSPDGNTLSVRGYVGIALFGQTYEWKRLTDPEKLAALQKGDPEKPEKKKKAKPTSHKPPAENPAPNE